MSPPPIQPSSVELGETPPPAGPPPTSLTTPPPVEPVETRSWRPHLNDRLNRHPEWLALLLAAAAWVGLALTLGWFAPGWGLPPGHHHGPDVPTGRTTTRSTPNC